MYGKKSFALFLFVQFFFILNGSILLSENNANIATHTDNEDCSGCNAYKCMDEKDAHCGSKGYLIAYGLPNCERFNSKEIYNRFNRIGKKFINCTGTCLIESTEHYILDHKEEGIDCGKLKEAGFKFHPMCYLKCNFCEVCKTNKWALLRGYRLRDFFSMDAIRQVVAVMNTCGLTDCLFGKDD